MANHPLWSDEYWLLLMQLYLKKPVGVKPLYSRLMVELSMELHIEPQFLYAQMFRLRSIDTPRIEKLWENFGRNPKKLSRGVKLLRQKLGYADLFYDGVAVQESFELDFKPIPALQLKEGGEPTAQERQYALLTPVMLILILDQYFRLTPITMVEETPEVQELAKLLRLKPSTVCEVMSVFQFCDPYLNRGDQMNSPLLNPCQQIWNRYGNDNPQKLAAQAAQLKEYFG